PGSKRPPSARDCRRLYNRLQPLAGPDEGKWRLPKRENPEKSGALGSWEASVDRCSIQLSYWCPFLPSSYRPRPSLSTPANAKLCRLCRAARLLRRRRPAPLPALLLFPLTACQPPLARE